MESRLCFLSVFGLLLVSSSVNSSRPTEAVFNILHSKLAKYNKNIRPGGAEPVQVEVSLVISSLEEVSEKTMDFTTSILFKQSWNDERLIYEEAEGDLQSFLLGLDMAQRIWVPDTVFKNEKTGIVPKLKSIRIKQNGSVSMVQQMRGQFSCPMDFSSFPYDRQNCSIWIKSSAHSLTDFRYKWKQEDNSSALQFGSTEGIPQWSILGSSLHLMEEGEILAGDIFLERVTEHWLLSVYLPAGLLTVITMLTCWLPREETTSRLMVCLFSLGFLLVLHKDSMVLLPKISYLRTLDIYLTVCYTMVLLCLVETVVARSLKIGEECGNLEKKEPGVREVKSKVMEVLRYCSPMCGLETCCRLSFPLVFLFFNVAYWNRETDSRK